MTATEKPSHRVSVANRFYDLSAILSAIASATVESSLFILYRSLYPASFLLPIQAAAPSENEKEEREREPYGVFWWA